MQVTLINQLCTPIAGAEHSSVSYIAKFNAIAVLTFQAKPVVVLQQ